MPQEFIRSSVLNIVNNVFERMGVSRVATIDANKFSKLALTYVNDVLLDLSNFGDWTDAYRVVTVTAASSVNRYTVRASADNSDEIVKRISEVYWSVRKQSLSPETVERINYYVRTSTEGVPRHYGVVGVSAGISPIIKVYPTPISAGHSTSEPFAFSASIYARMRILTTADSSVVPFFPAKLIEQGLYSKMLADDEGGLPTAEAAVQQRIYMEMRMEELNRFSYDSGTDIQFCLRRK